MKAISSKADPAVVRVAALTSAGYGLLLMQTHEEVRASAILQEAANRTGKPFFTWNLLGGFSALPGGGTTIAGHPRHVFALIANYTAPAIFLLQDLQHFFDDPEMIRYLKETSRGCEARSQSIVLVSAHRELPLELEREAFVFDLPLPGTENLATVLEPLLAAKKLEVDPATHTAALRAVLGLTLDQARHLFGEVLHTQGQLTQAELPLLLRGKRQLLQTTDALDYHEISDQLHDLGGLDQLKLWLKERARAFEPDARAFGLPNPKGILLIGVQGCGKSLTAKVVASLWKFPLLRLDIGAIFGQKQQSPETTLRHAIKVAESLAPVVLWIDEIDKAFGPDQKEDSSYRVFGSLITWLAEKESPVFVVATANEVAHLPPELIRRGRFDELFFVDLPAEAERLEILRIHLKKRGRNPDQYTHLNALAAATEYFSGAELEQIVISALHRAFREQRELKEEDLMLAQKSSVPLYNTYEERIKSLRDWAKKRARPAATDTSVLDLFRQ